MKEKYISYVESRRQYRIELRISGSRVVEYRSTLMDAIKRRNTLMNQKRAGIFVPKDKRDIPSTLKEAFEEYRLQVIDRTDMAVSTKDRYRYDANKVNRYLGDENPMHITTEQWERLFRNWLAAGSDYKHVRDCMSRYRDMYRYYQRLHYIEENPVNGVVLRDKHGIHGREQKPCFTEREKNIFLETVKQIYGWQWYTLFVFFFATGCRRGELLACQWEDVDWEKQTLHIGHSIGRGTVNGEYQEFRGRTKTPQSVRDIPLSGELMIILKQLKLYTGSVSPYIWHQVDCHGKYDWISLTAIQRIFNRARANCSIRQELTIHSIRHYFASKLVAAGVDLKTIQALGGWSTPDVLLTNYAKADEDKMREVMHEYLGSDKNDRHWNRKRRAE